MKFYYENLLYNQNYTPKSDLAWAADITKKLSQGIDNRLPIKPRRELIIHTDGTQFTSQAYNNFLKRKEGFVVVSISRLNRPKDNAVAKRFMRTFKEHKIHNKTFQEELFYQLFGGIF